MQYQIPRGLFDVIPKGKSKVGNSYIWQFIENKAREACKSYLFYEIRTPIFEKTDLFIRSVGESSDIIKKELYTFLDKKGRSLSLRPEGTAPVMRAFLENNLQNLPLPHKFYYIGPMFRYDRPQKGRYRQHHQFGVEYIDKKSFYKDAEIIDLLMHFYKLLNLHNLTLNINSIGDAESREHYKKALKSFLKPHFKDLSKDSQARFEKNCLRILDSKEKVDQEILKDAPIIREFLNQASKDYFKNLCSLLKDLEISYKIDEKLVRGLDYYSNFVFEVTTEKEGRQNSLGGGGRYDDLLKSLGGPDLSGVGFGTGIERIIEEMQRENISIKDPSKPFLCFIPLSKEAKKLSFLYASKLRKDEIPTKILLNIKKAKKALKLASEEDISFSIIIGEDEINKKSAIIKNMKKREQKSVLLQELVSVLKDLFKDRNKDV